MKKLLYIYFFFSPVLAISQIGLNERIDIGWLAQVFIAVEEIDDTLFIYGGGAKDDITNLEQFYSNSEDFSSFSEILLLNSNDYFGSELVVFGDSILTVSNKDVSGVDSLVVTSINFESQELIFQKSYSSGNTDAIRVYSVVTEDTVNVIYAIGGATENFHFDGMIFKTNKNGDSLWIKKYHDISLELEFSSAYPLNNENILIGGRKYDWGFPENTDDIHHTYVMEVDSAGTIQWEWTDPENWTYMPFSLSSTNDGGVIMGRVKAQLNDGNGNDGRCVITKLDGSQNIEWEYPIGEFTETIGTPENTLAGLVQVNDTTFVFGGTYNNWGTIDGVLIKITETGNVLWQRNILPPLVSTQIQSAIIYDMTTTSDGGFAMVGESSDQDGVGAYQQGWLVKTNCLGYLAPPSASCITGNLDNYCIRFANSSLQGGEFEWDFGDTQVQTTNEDEDTIVHVFSGEGPYNVRLIAKGCNGEADTIYFDVNPTLLGTDEQDEFGEGTFDVYPNPASNVAYVSMNILGALNQSSLVVTDVSGKVHQTIPVYQNEYTQEINLSNFAKGMYFVQLVNAGKVVKVKRLVVN